MRPFRLVATCTVAILGILCISFFATSRSRRASIKSQTSTPFSSPMSWTAPSSLFPPSAVISLTDDNSTFFLARPASFGPALPVTGLSGQLWIGSGFGDENLGRDQVATAAGELGCSDVPGWEIGRSISVANDEEPDAVAQSPDHPMAQHDQPILKHDKRHIDSADIGLEADHRDGTDDHLHQSLALPRQSSPHDKPGHADIQSIQESAEIAGKVVLLTRGGCGFLEKAKWVQRRGGTAMIVGDDVRGGALVTMYARGDTSNITIPSLFTSYTTAHLLSSLMPAGRSIGDLGHALRQSSHGRKSRVRRSVAKTKPRVSNKASKSSGWLSWLWPSKSHGKDSHRPPASGKNDWLMQDAFDAKMTKTTSTASLSSSSSSTTLTTTSKPSSKPGDGFVIGVNDWRDPDLMQISQTDDLTADAATPTQIESLAVNGGSITPGSGDYTSKSAKAVEEKLTNGAVTDADETTVEQGWLGWPWQHDSDNPVASDSDEMDTTSVRADRAAHEGLWVTLQPTSVSASPFFDALLVLVVSPLVTLSVVYALLLLRARLRRRRWRAPKSVVEQLPVRTYQTMPSLSSHSSRDESPTDTAPGSPTATTPLLRSASRPITYRPRSRTEGQVVASGSHGGQPLALSASSFGSMAEKREAALAEWKRKYGGRQRECVVCLEEYIDGVSKVMSLPCGHEFHADCITPWLTTRRRTCPICKGDVVRSLRSNNHPASMGTDILSRLYEQDEDEDEDQEEHERDEQDEHRHRHEHDRHEDSVGDGDLERGHQSR